MPMKLPVYASPMRARATDPAMQERLAMPEPVDPTLEILAGRAPRPPAEPAPTALGARRSLDRADGSVGIAGAGGWYRARRV